MDCFVAVAAFSYDLAEDDADSDEVESDNDDEMQTVVERAPARHALSDSRAEHASSRQHISGTVASP